MITRQTLEKRYGRVQWPRVLVLKGDDQDGYYLINDIDHLLRVAVQIVADRMKQSYYYAPRQPRLMEEVSDDVVATLPKTMQVIAQTTKIRNAREQLAFDRAAKDWALIQQAHDGDGLAAFTVLDNRKDHEYEDWSLEPLTNI